MVSYSFAHFATAACQILTWSFPEGWSMTKTVGSSGPEPGWEKYGSGLGSGTGLAWTCRALRAATTRVAVRSIWRVLKLRLGELPDGAGPGENRDFLYFSPSLAYVAYHESCVNASDIVPQSLSTYTDCRLTRPYEAFAHALIGDIVKKQLFPLINAGHLSSTYKSFTLSGKQYSRWIDSQSGNKWYCINTDVRTERVSNQFVLYIRPCQATTRSAPFCVEYHQFQTPLFAVGRWCSSIIEYDHR
jgi:hypothetical protein